MLIALVNTKGGVGKSTICVHTAVWLHEHGLRVALLDADEQASSTQWLGQAAPAIPIIPLRSSGQVLREGPALAASYDAVIADAPAALDARSAALISIADLAVMPILPSTLDIWASYRTARLIYRVQFHPKRGGLPHALTVLNRVQSRTRLARVAAEAVRRYGFPVSTIALESRQAFVEACALGTVVWRLGARGAAGAAEFTQLVELMLRQMPESSVARRVLAHRAQAGGGVIAQRVASADQVPAAPPIAAPPIAAPPPPVAS